MNIDKWIDGYKVRAFPWPDGKRIYFNVQYYKPGQSVEKPPVWDKTVYVTDNEAGRKCVFNFTDSLVHYVAGLKLDKDSVVTLTAESLVTMTIQ